MVQIWSHYLLADVAEEGREAELEANIVRRNDVGGIQGYLAQEKYPPPRTLQQDFTQGPMVVITGGAVSREQGTPVWAVGFLVDVPACGRC